jgi:hypothetical protein
MADLHCQFCHEGPFRADEVVRIRTTAEEFIFCGSASCVKKLFNAHDPATFARTADICPSCENHPTVAAVINQGHQPFSVCSRCLIAIFFDRSSIS